MWRNTTAAYGLVSVVLHWLVALAVFGLFGLGLWMVGLSYYSPWYTTAPMIHIGVGVLLGAVLILRLVWRLANPRPAFEPTLGRAERIGALSAHAVMYVLMFGVTISGYLIPSAQGDPVSVFGWFSLPPLVAAEGQQDLAGWLHYYGAWALVLIAGVHTLAALKHHFIDRDRTLIKMLRPGR